MLRKRRYTQSLLLKYAIRRVILNLLARVLGNVSFKMTDVKQLTHDAIAAVTEDDWASSCRHVEEVERKYWDADIAVIQVTSSDEDTDTATECSDYSDTESKDEECLF